MPCMPGDLEVLVADAGLEQAPSAEKDATEIEYLSTVLISVRPPPEARRSMRALAEEFVAAHCVIEQAPKANLADWVSRLLAARPKAGICLVLALPEFTPTDAVLVHIVLDAFLAFSHRLDLVVVVAPSPGEWFSCKADGYIKAAPGCTHAAARHMFNMGAALLAPGLFSCLDAGDLRPALGTPDQPSQVIESVWITESAALVLSRDADRTILKESCAVAFLADTMADLKNLSSMHRAVKLLAAPSADLVIAAPFGLKAASVGGFVPVAMFCR